MCAGQIRSLRSSWVVVSQSSGPEDPRLRPDIHPSIHRAIHQSQPHRALRLRRLSHSHGMGRATVQPRLLVMDGGVPTTPARPSKLLPFRAWEPWEPWQPGKEAPVPSQTGLSQPVWLLGMYFCTTVWPMYAHADSNLWVGLDPKIPSAVRVCGSM